MTVVDGSMTRNSLVADYSEWKARDYFQTYYSEVVLPDEQAVLAYQIDVLRAARARFGRGLEYGCGRMIALPNGSASRVTCWPAKDTRVLTTTGSPNAKRSRAKWCVACM